MKDQEIIERIKKGDESAAEYLYKQHFSMMSRLIKKNSGSEDDAKDIYQDAIIVFWEKITSGDFVLSSKISTYLYSVCFNLWRKELERRKKLSSQEVEGSVELDTNTEERVQAIRRCIDKLSETCQSVLKLYYFDNLQMSEIAQKLNFSNADTAKTKKYKCKKELDKLVLSIYKPSDFLD